MKYIALFFCLFFLGVLSPLKVGAQEVGENSLLKEISQEDRLILRALVLYPTDIAKAAAELALHPNALIQVQTLQVKTEIAFQDLMAVYDEQEQKDIFWVLALPGLREAILDSGPDNKKAFKTIAARYPKALKKTIIRVGKNHFGLLTSIDEQLRVAEQAFDTLLLSYPDPVKEALRKLKAYPEVLNLMAENTRAVIMLGYFYQKNPDELSRLRDESFSRLEKAFSEEKQAWVNACQQEGIATEDLVSAVKDFSEELDLEVKTRDKSWFFEMTGELGFEQVPAYPYWTGYPWWQVYPYWKVYPYFYHSGFYLEEDKSLSVISLPSYPFLHWMHEHAAEYPYAFGLLRRFYHDQGQSGTIFSLVMSLYESERADVPDGLSGSGSETEKIKAVSPPLPNEFKVFKAVDYNWISWDYRMNATP